MLTASPRHYRRYTEPHTRPVAGISLLLQDQGLQSAHTDTSLIMIKACASRYPKLSDKACTEPQG